MHYCSIFITSILQVGVEYSERSQLKSNRVCLLPTPSSPRAGPGEFPPVGPKSLDHQNHMEHLQEGLKPAQVLLNQPFRNQVFFKISQDPNNSAGLQTHCMILAAWQLESLQGPC